ncbi:PEP/pyruvate-binding domain-containing protein [Pendulispora albinea]|uniref:Phosphoenolpyruvate synthase n=1 Tax=Pendulispora albinea TaxID=2741071 RepID=A0ABZ2LM32_9BACT
MNDTCDRIVIGGTGEKKAPLPARLVGGKGANLDLLLHRELPVPRWFCVTTRAFEHLVSDLRHRFAARLAALAWAADDEVIAFAGELRRAARALPLEADDERRILESFDSLFGTETWVAVRSSAVGEDGSRASYAGQMDSYLFVTRAELIARIKDCFASAFSDRALLYRRKQGAELIPYAAVIVQEIVRSEVSGVLFTANPSTGDHGEAVIAAAYGLGEGVVTDRVEADTFFIHRATRRPRDRQIRNKGTRIVFDQRAGHGTCIAEVPDARAHLPALDDVQLDTLLSMGERALDLFGCPQDVEWAIDAEGKIYVLQARPITTLKTSVKTSPPPEPAGTRRVFDNTNIVESYPGATTPLTFSFVRKGYEIVFRQTARAFGIAESTLARERATIANMVALVEGRIYYNIENWYRYYSLVPGLERNLEAWKQALGLKDATARVPRSPARLLQELRVRANAVRNFAGLRRDLASFQRRMADFQSHFRGRNVDELSADELLVLYESVLDDLIRHWEPTTVNDLFAFNFHYLLGRFIASSGFEDHPSLQNDLLCGERGMESVEPVRSVLALTQRIRESDALRRLFDTESHDGRVWQSLCEDPAHEAFRAQVERHIELYGDRTVEELKLETSPLSENPAWLIALCRGYLRAGTTYEQFQEREARIRSGAERTVAERLRRRPWTRLAFTLLLEETRRAVRNRENTRLARSRMFGMVKRIFRAMGRRFHEQGLLGDASDIFYLTVEEIEAAIRGSAVTRGLGEIVAIRRREFQAFAERDTESRIVTQGIVSAHRAAGIARTSIEAAPASLLRGQGCAPGVVRGRARIVRDPKGAVIRPDEILVAAMTDPGWVFLMVAARGLVVERGSILSHTAIIGRELGIPTIVAVEGATRRIADGAELELDGGLGTVRVL